MQAIDRAFVAHYPGRKKAEHRLPETRSRANDLRGHLMFKPLAALLIITCLCAETAFAQPRVRKFDDPGSPPFKVLGTGENPPLNADDNFVIGPEYIPARERNVVEGVPQGKVKQFTIDSKETKTFNPG